MKQVISRMKSTLANIVKLEFTHKGNYKTSRREWEIEVKTEDHWITGNWEILKSIESITYRLNIECFLFTLDFRQQMHWMRSQSWKEHCRIYSLSRGIRRWNQSQLSHIFQLESSYKLTWGLSYYYALPLATPWGGGHHCCPTSRQTCPGKATWAPAEGSGGTSMAHMLHVSQSPWASKICLVFFF